MIDVEKLFDLNIGLVLAGGGAKGAYEAGVFKALWELDIIRRVSVVSGTSIGTINGLMLSMNDGNVMDKSWSNISYSRFINNENKIRDINIKKLITSGDTEVDREFTSRGITILPKHSSFKHEKAIITEKSKIHATEEILDYINKIIM